MKTLFKLFCLILPLILAVSCTAKKPKTSEENQDKQFWQYAKTPPMGWNSWDCYGPTVTESEVKANADYMAANLKQHGWEYIVVDIRWFVENDKAGGYNQNDPVFTIDEYGRLLPAVKKFPSAADGKGFKPIADYVHSKGMKFGIHIIRGIPRQAVALNTPILGTKYHAKDIIHDTPKSWTMNMHMVDVSKPGAQEYYNSIFKMYAEWGVDLIKADDMMKPFYHKGEIEMMHKAIAQCGRPMVLSLSWGEAPLSFAGNLVENANMWRISGDFWDNWPEVAHMFDLTAQWVPFVGPNSWPDADMLPIGKLCLTGYPRGNKPEHLTKLSDDEITTMMSLWCIARSPLMWGGDPLSTPASYEKFLLNDEILTVNQKSANNHQVWNNNNSRFWIADVPNSNDKYLAMFNLGEKEQKVKFSFYWENLKGNYTVRDLWKKENMEMVTDTLTRVLKPHASLLLKLEKQ